MEQIDSDVFIVIVSAISIVGGALFAACYKLYTDKEKLHEHAAQIGLAHIEAANRHSELLRQLRDQLQSNHAAATMAVEKITDVEKEIVRLSVQAGSN